MRYVAKVAALAAVLAAMAGPAAATCRVENGALVCDPRPQPTPGGGDLHPTLIDRILGDATTVLKPQG